MTMDAKDINLYELLKPYKNRWVAIAPDLASVSASGSTLEETRAKLDEKTKKTSFFMKVVGLDVAYEPVEA